MKKETYCLVCRKYTKNVNPKIGSKDLVYLIV